VASIFLAGGYFLVFAFCCVLPVEMARAVDDRTMRLPINVLCGFSPPVCVAWLPIREFKEDELSFDRQLPFPPFWVIGLIGWGALSVGLARKTVAKFKLAANRVAFELTGPERFDLLAHVCPLDLDPRVWAPGRCAQTLLGRAQVVLQERTETTGILMRPSFADYVVDLLLAVHGAVGSVGA